jgi:hypothetical protein
MFFFFFFFFFFFCLVIFSPLNRCISNGKCRHLLFIKLVRFILFGSLKNYANLSGFSVAFILTYHTEFPPPFVASSLYRGFCLS